MRNHLKAMLGAGVAAGALAVSTSAMAAPSAANGVFFVHGTGDYTPPSSNDGFQSTNDGSAVTSYWTQSTLNAYATAPQGGSWSYGTAGYSGNSYPAYDSNAWGVVGDQLWEYYYNGNSGQIYNVVVVTHSNGNNPIRYMMAHPTAVTPGGVTVSTILSVVYEAVFIAADNTGTPLADKVTQSGSFGNIANDVVSFFGGGNYNSPSVVQQIQANMATYNSNGTFATGSTPGGLLTQYIYGSAVYANIFSGDAWCGGYSDTVGLKACALYGWGSFSAATDGFIGTNSATYVGTNGGYGGDSRLNHQQSRRNCHGVGGRIANEIHGAMSGTFTSPPPDYTISPAAQACNATVQGWQSASPYAGYNYWYGCTSSMHTDSHQDFDCEVAYGYDDGYNVPDSYSSTAYAVASNYNNGGAGCSDSWLGDGECDMCLIAKYGYDSQTGSTQDGDCVNRGAGTYNYCADFAYYNSSSQSFSGGVVQYVEYSASHEDHH